MNLPMCPNKSRLKHKNPLCSLAFPCPHVLPLLSYSRTTQRSLVHTLAPLACLHSLLNPFQEGLTSSTVLTFVMASFPRTQPLSIFGPSGPPSPDHPYSFVSYLTGLPSSVPWMASFLPVNLCVLCQGSVFSHPFFPSNNTLSLGGGVTTALHAFSMPVTPESESQRIWVLYSSGVRSYISSITLPKLTFWFTYSLNIIPACS